MLIILCFFVATTAIGQQTGNKDFLLQLDNYHGQIQWEQSVDRTTWREVPNGNVGKVNLTPNQTTLYRAKVTDEGCSPVYSDIKAAFFDKGRVVPAKMIKGKVDLPAGATEGFNGYTIMSEVESSDVNSDGSFEILAADSTEQDVLLVLNGKEEVTMLGHYIGPQEEYVINSESSAMALLVMYPFLKPIPVSEKKALIKSYRAEAEFKQLISKVDALAKESGALFSSANDGIRTSINLLINKDYNKDRFRLQSVNDLISHPLDISSDGASVNIINSQPFSYVGSIYRKSDELKVKAFFIVPGTLLRSSSFVQIMRPPGYSLEKEDLQYERIFDLRSLGKEEGEYEIKLRSGLAMDNTDEDNLARGENTYEMLMYILDNLSLGVADKKHSDAQKERVQCFGSLADVMSTKVKAEITINPKTDILKEVFIPALSAVYDGAGKCGNSNFFSYTSKVLKFIDIFNKKEEHLAAWTFPISWVAANEDINACQYLGQNPVSKEYKTTSCFIFNKITKIDDSYFPGDTIPITVGAFTNHKYYPYFSEVVQKLDFTWLTLTGVFAPDGKVNPAGKTNSKGEATVKWVLSCKEERNNVTVSLPGIEYSLYKDIFTTMTKVPGLKVEKTGDNQEGEKGKALSKPITFIIKDLSDNWATNLNRFNIKWEVYKNGGWQVVGDDVIKDDKPYDPNKHLFVSKNWKLADVDGEQKIRATIEDKCGDKYGKYWNIEGNPVVFTANPHNPWIEIMLGRWEYQAYFKLSDELYEKYKKEHEINAPNSFCGRSPTFIGDDPILGNNTILWYEPTQKYEVEFNKDFSLYVHQFAYQLWGSTVCSTKPNGSISLIWSVSSTGFLGAGDGKGGYNPVPMSGQLVKIDDNTYYTKYQSCLDDFCNDSYTLLKRK